MKLLIDEEVLRQALEYLKFSYPAYGKQAADCAVVMDALRTALDASEKVEPVAWWEQDESTLSFKAFRGGAWTPLYDLRGLK